jgi:exopolyphosphatase/guanosine-5'-triphosphate,3'-diphosphate pyrophosphatase
MRAGCIDIGSNTTRLLVAERVGGRLCECHQERVFTRIGRGLTAGGSISAEKIDEVVEVVRTQLRRAAEWDVRDVRGVATAAIRGAANGHALVAAIRDATGLQVEILSGEEEARLAFVGAAAMLDERPSGDLGVVDVGGGSSEMVVGMAPASVSWWASVAVGSSTLTDEWLHTDPPAPAELAAARRHVVGCLAELEPPRPAMAVAVGGSATSLCRLAGVVLDAGALVRSLRLLATETSAAVAQRTQIDPQRARLLPAGLLILEAMSARFQTTITVGRGGIREGVVLEALSA